MPRAATEVMQSILFSTVLDAVEALKGVAKGVPNNLLREIQRLHPNTTFEDLPPELQQAIATSVRAAFTRLLKEGYSVSPSGSAPPPRPPVNRHGGPGGGGPRQGRGPGRGPRPGGGRPGAGAGKPGGGKPGGGKPPRKPQS